MKKIVAAETGEGVLRLFFHDGGKFRTREVPFAPFVLLADGEAVPEGCTVTPLSGGGFFRRQAFFPSAEACEKALPELKKSPRTAVFRDTVQQALSMTGLRLFSEMTFSELRRMQFLVVPGDDRIAAIRLTLPDGMPRELSGDEAEIIAGFAETIRESDPDVLEGFNCCRADLPLLVRRAAKLKIPLACGRDGGDFTVRQSRYTAGDKQYSYQKFTLAGRHIADLLHAAQLYDAVHRDMEELDLPSLRAYFRIGAEYPPALIRALAEILLPAYFYRTRELPLSFQECLLRGSGSALDALMTAEYLRRGLAIPLPEPARPYAGAMTGMEVAGVFRGVRHCDVRSLYPSLLLNRGESPRRDEAGIFLDTLRRLREFRLAAKDRARALPPGPEQRQQQALQSSFKILINSFYGYLGFAQGSFNDFDLAEKITATGRELLGKLVRVLLDHGATVIEMDTDGIYFQPPPGGSAALDAALTAALPEGIALEFDAEYPAMYSYKAKNYALLHADGSIHLTGAALRSRALENFQRKFILAAVTARLTGDGDGARRAYGEWKTAIANHAVPLADLAKSEILSDSPENYRKKLAAGSTRRSAAYELALTAGRPFRAGDKVRFYVTGTKAKVSVTDNARLLEDGEKSGVRDENTAYYLAKLDALADSFGIFDGKKG